MKATATSTVVDNKSSRMPNHLVKTMYRYHPCNAWQYIDYSVITHTYIYLCVLIIEGMKALDCNILLTKCPDGGETL